MPNPLPVTVLSAVDPVLHDATTMSVLMDAPTVVAVSYASGPTSIRRTVSDTGGVLESEAVHLEHVCLNCALREDIVPTLLRLAELERWSGCVLALPVGAEPIAVTQALTRVDGASRQRRLRVASSTTVLDLSSLEEDVFGDDLLDERGIALAHDDRRAVGEALCHQVEYADIVIAANPPDRPERAAELLDHLQAPGTERWAGPYDADGGRLFSESHDSTKAARRLDPRHVQPRRRDGRHFWTADLSSSRPLHPERLMDRIEELGTGRIRARGRFWLPTRPDSVCAWDGAGGQLSIGDAGGWAGRARSTRLVVTGAGDDRRRLRDVFEQIVLRDTEMARDVAQWVMADDGFDPWLGSRSAVANPRGAER